MTRKSIRALVALAACCAALSAPATLLAQTTQNRARAALRRNAPQPQVTHVVTLKASAQTRGTEIMLGDVATVRPDGLVARKMLGTVLAQAPKTRLPRELTLQQIRQSVAAHGFDIATLQFSGSNRTVVQPLFRRVNGTEVKDAAEVVLQAVLDAEGANNPKVDYRLTTNLRAIDVPPGRRSMQTFARVKGGATQASSAIVQVMFQVDGREWKTINLNYQLTRYQYVLKATGPIRKDTPLGEHNLERSVVPARGAAGLFAQDFHDVEGMVARRNLRSGFPLSMTTDIAPPAVIRKGSRVTLVVTNGTVKVTATVIARSDAAVGEPVELLNPESGRVVSATAIGKGLASLDVTVPSRQGNNPTVTTGGAVPTPRR